MQENFSKNEQNILKEEVNLIRKIESEREYIKELETKGKAYICLEKLIKDPVKLEKEIEHEFEKCNRRLMFLEELYSFVKRFELSEVDDFWKWIDSLPEKEYIKFGDLKNEYGDTPTIKLVEEISENKVKRKK